MGSQATLDALMARLKTAGLRVHDASPEPPPGGQLLPTSSYPYVLLFGDAEPAEFRRRAGVPSHRTMRVQAMFVGLTSQQCRWAADKADAALTGWHLEAAGRSGYRVRTDWPGELTRDDDIPSRPLYSITNRYVLTSIQH